MRDVDQQIQEIYSKYWDELRQKVKLGQKLLLVEGDDDRVLVEQLLIQLDGLWTTKVVVAAAGGRDKVLKKLQDNPSWFGLVDRDTWDAGEVADHKAACPNLVVTEGWCLENDLCDAALLESLFSLTDKKLAAINASLDAWISYGGIRWTLQRNRDGLGANMLPVTYGRPDRMAAEPHDAASLLSAMAVRTYDEKLQDATAAVLVRRIQARQEALAASTAAERLLKSVPGKEFFRAVVVQALNREMGQQPEARWRPLIASKMAGRWPEYLMVLARQLL